MKQAFGEGPSIDEEEEKEEGQEPPVPALEEEPEGEEAAGEGDRPAWGMLAVPEGMRLPQGAPITFLRFRTAWCDYRARGKGIMTGYREPRVPGKPEEGMVVREHLSRVLVLWPLTYAEERQALRRAKDNATTYDELAKGTIRAVDGMRIDWTGAYAKKENGGILYSANNLWEELGPKCRPLVIANYRQMSALSNEDLQSFLLDCVVVGRPEAG
jgi:hypothetical protein